MEDITGQKISALFKGQAAWFILIAIIAAVFAYGEINAMRLFNDTPTESWNPEGSGSHSNHSRHSNIHHK